MKTGLDLESQSSFESRFNLNLEQSDSPKPIQTNRNSRLLSGSQPIRLLVWEALLTTTGQCQENLTKFVHQSKSTQNSVRARTSSEILTVHATLRGTIN